MAVEIEGETQTIRSHRNFLEKDTKELEKIHEHFSQPAEALMSTKIGLLLLEAVLKLIMASIGEASGVSLLVESSFRSSW